MKSLREWSVECRRQIIGVFTDIDDTLTTDGAITPDALQALHDLNAAGLHVIAITGRPVGWSEAFALEWPVDCIVAENGSVALFKGDFLYKNSLSPAKNLRGVLSKSYQSDAITREHNYTHLQQVLTRIEREVHGAQRSTDSLGRETDIAIDHSEFTHLSPSKISQVVEIMQSEGLQATVSSIHINGWIGSHNKLQGAHWVVRELYDRDLAQEMDRWVYVGDSTNDQLMFEAFDNSIGVANLARFFNELKALPRYITQGERGAGFAEVAALLKA
ncbi:HAD-IIB family hydrolase [Variovorax sp. PCZ-1]|uniref:HAD family hydrolase n=1 Tax=Variovorax sp. PCZ-1 TaxID=2835533 RepID=UPI001BCF8D15|nr:HAD-IIB family hydrolase [Variovorax sp. PCZ-1]MBS7806501.1 HAD family phosphatase [Variovorax sp. PCZ-1]